MYLQDSAVCTLDTKQIPQPGGDELTESTFRTYIFLGADYIANRDHSAVISNSQNNPCRGADYKANKQSGDIKVT